MDDRHFTGYSVREALADNKICSKFTSKLPEADLFKKISLKNTQFLARDYSDGTFEKIELQRQP